MTTIATYIFQRRPITSFGNDSKKKLLVFQDHGGKHFTSKGPEEQSVLPKIVPKLPSTQARESLHQEAQGLQGIGGLNYS
jgi:hypothetical protein